MISPKQFVIRALSAMAAIAVAVSGLRMAYSLLRYDTFALPFWKGAMLRILFDLCFAVSIYGGYRFMRFALRGN